MPDLPNLVQLAIPVYLLAILVEMGLAHFRGLAKYETRDTLTSLSMAVGVLIFAALTGFVEIGTLRYVQQRWGLVDWGWSPWVFVLCFVLDDFRKYWLHRAQHRVRWFWAAHVTHHSSQHYNFGTALRNPPTVPFTPAFLFRLPLALLGFPIELILFVAGIDSIYQFFTHTEVIGRLPAPIEWLMVTPSHHRVHHATNPRYLDANYGAVFIVWDRWFGTFVEEDAEEACRYGLVTNLGTLQVGRVVVHEWVAMVKDLLRPGLTAAQRFGYVLGEPGYSHDGSREGTAAIRARHARAARALEVSPGPERAPR